MPEGTRARARLAASEDTSIRLHPNMAGYYRAQIADLRTALSDTGRNKQAARDCPQAR